MQRRDGVTPFSASDLVNFLGRDSDDQATETLRPNKSSTNGLDTSKSGT